MALVVICLIVLGISTVEVINRCTSMILAREYSLKEVSTIEVDNTHKSMNLAREYCIKEARA